MCESGLWAVLGTSHSPGMDWKEVEMQKLKEKLLSKDGVIATPLKFAIIGVIFFVAVTGFDLTRMFIVVRGVDAKVENAAHRAINSNYQVYFDELLSKPGHEEEVTTARINEYDVYSELDDVIGLERDGFMYIHYAGDEREFELSDMKITYSDPISEGRLVVTIKVNCTVFWQMPFKGLPGITIPIKHEAGFNFKFKEKSE
jgi:hypothetical protein